MVASMNKKFHADRGPIVGAVAQGEETFMAVTIDQDACLGCSACVDTCPQQVLELVDDKATVANPDDCVECGACESACPAEAITL